MKISVIVPVYKAENYIRRCVDSILGQTFQDFELILVDDGSPDRSGVICEEYARRDGRVHVFHQKNGGVSNARNQGICHATGDYMTFCDCDDFYSPEWIATLAAAAERSKADVVRGNLTFYHENPRLNSSLKTEVGIYDLSTQEKKVQYCFSKLFTGKHDWAVCTRLFRTDIVKQNQICFCETCGNFAEDMCFVLEYSLYANCVISIDNAGYMYFQRDDSMMASSKGKAKLDCVNEVSIFFAEKSKKVFDPEYAEKILPIFHFCIMFNQYHNLMMEYTGDEVPEIIRSIVKYAEWETMTRKIASCEEILYRYFDRKQADGILRLSESCISGNWEKITNRYRKYVRQKELRVWIKEVVFRVFGGSKCQK